VDNGAVSDLLQAFVDEVTNARTLDNDPASFESGKRILALAPEQQIELLIQLVNRQVARITTGATSDTLPLRGLVGGLLRRKLPFTALLADDRRITDPLIVSQIRGRWPRRCHLPRGCET
jgi:hypothetical protein